MSEARNDVFQQLKPVCVALNQAILSFQGRAAPPESVIRCAEAILQTLKTLSEDQLNPHLAEYVFVPLSFILRSSQQLPVHASEVAFECLALLIQLGWREQVAGPLGSQLLILLAITADQSDKSRKSAKPTQELLKAAFDCIGHLLCFLERTKPGRAQLVEATFAPHLGHLVTVILDGIVSDGALDTQLSAASSLQNIVLALDDHEVLASFLPGIISTTTKVLTPSTKHRRHWHLLLRCLDIMTCLLRKSISDSATVHISSQSGIPQPNTGGVQALSASWLEATAGQLKLAFSNINRLYTHDRLDVLKSLANLNLTILRDCTAGLSNCWQICLETLLVLLEDEQLADIRADITTLIYTNSKLSETLEATVHDWSISLPRILESSDEDKKARRLKQIFLAYQILKDSGCVSTSLQQLIASNLPDYTAIILRTLGQDKTLISQTPAVRLENLPLALRTDRTVSFPNALASSKYQAQLLSQMQQELAEFATPDLAESITFQMRQSTGDVQISAMWLSLQLIKSSPSSSTDMFLDMGEDDQVWRGQIRDDLYDFSLMTIERDDADWRLHALSLEAIAGQAIALGTDFRNELIDALYPVLHMLGGENPRLRQHAMVCLNVISDACGFADVKELVVANADYLVNAVALRLNSFDVSPQGPQVLLMMVNLAGPSLVPYLEDTVASIFAVLEDYHGYTTLVELLFSVLNAISAQGVQESRLQIEGSSGAESYPSLEWRPLGISDLVGYLHDRRHPPPMEPLPEPIDPEAPPLDAQEPSGSDSVTTSQPKGKTFPLLLRIAQQTQHHLSSSSPSLRLLLLTQLSTLIPCIARHEDTFLPLINTLWPELVPRLADTEDAVARAALDTMTLIASLAGGFLKSRVRQLWPALRVLRRRVDGAVSGGPKGTEVGYLDPSAGALRVSFRNFLVAVATHVGLDEEAFDETLTMVGEENLPALAAVNADAVWASQQRSRQTLNLPVPGGGYAWAPA